MSALTGVPLHLFGLALVAAWVLLRPLRSRRALLAIGWAGLFFYRLVPLIVNVADEWLAPEDRPPLFGSMHLLGWIGSLLLLRALTGAALWARPRTRRFRWMAGLYAVGWTGLAVADGAAGVLFLAMIFPLLFSFRWRDGAGALDLLVANLTAVLAFFLTITVFSQREPGWSGAWSGLQTLPGQLTLPLLLYALFAVFATARRIHLSVRRIGRRLAVSHVLAAAVPFGLAVLFLLLSGSLFLSTYRGLVAERILSGFSSDAVSRIDAAIRGTGTVPRDPYGAGVPAQAVLVRRAGAPLTVVEGSVPFPVDSILARPEGSDEVPFVWDGRSLFLRARWDGPDPDAPAESLRVEAFVPVDSTRMSGIATLLGVAVRVNPSLSVQREGGGISLQDLDAVPAEDPEGGDDAAPGDPPRARSIGPEDPDGWRIPGGTVVNVFARRMGDAESAAGWTTTSLPVVSSAGFGEPIASLFSVSRENPLATVVLLVLGILAAFFLGTLWIAASMVTEMSRTITRSVGALTEATAAIGRGRFDHRIEVEGNDEIWSVARSFNRMAADLETNRLAERERHRIEEELRLARVIQDRLLPASPPILPRLELAGLSVPAREVGGDYFDYIVLPDGRVGLAVADVSGKGTPAALLMSTFRASLRSQDLAAAGPAEALGRVNQFIHSSIDPGRFITAFLGLLDPATGEIRYANAGHDPPVLVHPDGRTEVLAGGGLILGMLPQIVYEEARFRIPEGGLLAAYTDGVTEAQDGDGEFFGPENMVAELVDRRERPCAEILQHLVRRIQVFRGPADPSDDITVVLARRN